MRKKTIRMFPKLKSVPDFSIDQYVSYHFNQNKHGVIVLIFSEMIKMCVEIRKNGKCDD